MPAVCERPGREGEQLSEGFDQQLRAAVDELRHGKVAEAAAILRELADEVPPEQMPWELLAIAEARAQNAPGALYAADKLLALDSRSIPGLLLKAQLLEQEGDARAAISHYRAAINQEALTGRCPDQFRSVLAHGHKFIAESEAKFAEYLFDTVGSAPTARAGMALDLLTGKRELYLQQPNVFYFPELPQRQFFRPEEFDWFAPILALLPQMQAELREIEKEDAAQFEAYVRGDPSRPAPNNPLLDDPAWGAFWFWRGGEPVSHNAERCPATMEALSHAPMPVIAGRSPVAHWSRLQPGTHIQPHHGMLNTRLICHVPIKIAPGCTLRVGNEVREWTDGVPLIFDDSIEHEARNAGDQSRTVLLFEIWRPELSEEERVMLTRVFEAIGDYEATGTNSVG